MNLDSTRAKVILALGGTLIGLLFGLVVAKTVIWFNGSGRPAGAEFESIEDLRRAMLTRDERDLKDDNSVSFRSIIEPDDSDLIIYRLRPQLDVRFEGARVQTNSHGLRDAEVSKEKAPGTYRIALLGDSFAFGWGVPIDQSFADVMERTLNTSQTKKKVEVLNFGVPGYSSFQEAALFEKYGLQFQPDVVLVYFIENDFGLPFFIKNFNESGDLVNNRHFQNLKKESEDTEAETDHRALLKNLDANKALRGLAERLKEKNIPVYVVVNPGKNYEKTTRRLKKLTAANNLTLFSIRSQVKDEIDNRQLKPEELRLPKDPHPSALKHDILGRALAGEFLPIVLR